MPKHFKKLKNYETFTVVGFLMLHFVTHIKIHTVVLSTHIICQIMTKVLKNALQINLRKLL